MARQLTVRIPHDLENALASASGRLQKTPSEIVRMALRQFLSLTSADQRPAQRVADLIGVLDSRVPDLAERHRDYVLQSIQNEE